MSYAIAFPNQDSSERQFSSVVITRTEHRKRPACHNSDAYLIVDVYYVYVVPLSQNYHLPRSETIMIK